MTKFSSNWPFDLMPGWSTHGIISDKGSDIKAYNYIKQAINNQPSTINNNQQSAESNKTLLLLHFYRSIESKNPITSTYSILKGII